MPFDDYQERFADEEGHKLIKTVHRHEYDDGVDVDLETNEDMDRLAVASYIRDNIEKMEEHNDHKRMVMDAMNPKERN